MTETERHQIEEKDLYAALNGRVVRGSGEVAPSEGPETPRPYAVLDLRFGGTLPDIARVDLMVGGLRKEQLLEVLTGPPLPEDVMAVLRPELARIWKKAIEDPSKPHWGNLVLGGVHVHADSLANDRAVLGVEGLQRGFWRRMGDFLNQGPKVTLTSGVPVPLEVMMSFLRSLTPDLQAIANLALADLHPDLKVETGWTAEISSDLVNLQRARSRSFFEQLIGSRSA